MKTYSASAELTVHHVTGVTVTDNGISTKLVIHVVRSIDPDSTFDDTVEITLFPKTDGEPVKVAREI